MIVVDLAAFLTAGTVFIACQKTGVVGCVEPRAKSPHGAAAKEPIDQRENQPGKGGPTGGDRQQEPRPIFAHLGRVDDCSPAGLGGLVRKCTLAVKTIGVVKQPADMFLVGNGGEPLDRPAKELNDLLRLGGITQRGIPAVIIAIPQHSVEKQEQND